MNNLPLQPIIWSVDKISSSVLESAKSPIHGYFITKTEKTDKFAVGYYRNGGKGTDYATGFATIEEAKAWAWNHYNEKMQPYVKPMPTWIDASERLPEEDGLYLALRKGFTFEMGNASDLVPKVSGWNGGRGCFDDDYGNVLITHWMPIPEFSTMQNLHKGGDCG